MPHDLPKSYEPGAIEARWAEYWVKEKLFSVPTPREGDTRSVFSLLLPPPNVTGRLHMGHMLNQTQMDIIMRWHRMRGDVTLWLPGTDHAGIATQMMVERQLASEGKKRSELGREEFVRAGVVRGKSSMAARFRNRCGGWARRWTGAANISPWTRTFRARCAKCLSGCMKKG